MGWNTDKILRDAAKVRQAAAKAKARPYEGYYGPGPPPVTPQRAQRNLGITQQEIAASAPSSATAPTVSPALAAKARRVEAHRKNVRKLQRILKVLQEDDTDTLAPLNPSQRERWEKAHDPETIADKAEKRIDDLWHDTKQITGLRGPAPKVKLGSRRPGQSGAAAFVTPKGTIKFADTGELIAPPVKFPGQKVTRRENKKALRKTVLHEFAHVGQVRAEGGTKGTPKAEARREGRAERFALLASKALGRDFDRDDFSSSYDKFRKASRKTDSPRKVLYGQFRGQKVSGEPRASYDKGDKKKVRKIAVEVPEIVPPKMRKAVAKHGQRLNDALKQAGSELTGPEYLAKLVEFESGWNPKAENPSSAYGLGQFIDSTAQDFRERLGVETQDPSKPIQMIKGASLHASGKAGYGALYAGYNPGYSDTDPIPGVASGSNVKVKIKAKAAEKAAGGKVATSGSAPKKASGAWAGSQRKVLEVIPKAFRPEGKGDKRTPEANAAVGGSSTSDHLTTNEAAYAADLPADDSLARKIAKKLGMGSHTGTNEVTKDGYRYQLIWQDAGHYDHIHLGATWTGESAPAGTSFGGSVTSTGLPSTVSTASTTVADPLTPASAIKSKRDKKRKAKRVDNAERQALIREIIAEGPVAAPVIDEIAAPAIREKVSLGL